MKRLLVQLFTGVILASLYTTAAFAGRAAVIFIEMEHEDSDKQTLEEVSTVYITATRLNPLYERLYWLVNIDATRDGLVETMQQAFNNHDIVDAYIIGHGGMQFFWCHFDDRVTVDDIIGLKSLPNSGRLRFVYIGSCHSWDLTDECIEAGAVSAVGSNIKMSNFPFYPNFLYYFGTLGYNLSTAVRLSRVPLIDDFRVRGDSRLRLKSEH
jgi:hypothetical protein